MNTTLNQNRGLILFIVAALIVILAITFTSVAGSPAASPMDRTVASKYEDRFDRMNDVAGIDPSYSMGKYEDRYDIMNATPGTER
jgi:hypothetical protein